MNWELHIARRAQKALEKLPAKDQHRIMAALDEIAANPFSGDIKRLRNEPATWRRRVGSYRVFFDIDPEKLLVEILEITRRTSTTY